MRALGYLKWNKCQPLKELVLEDDERPEKSLLYKLSENGVLSRFAFVVLVASRADQYAPFDSASIQVV